jgi:hypothetical protein
MRGKAPAQLNRSCEHPSLRTLQLPAGIIVVLHHPAAIGLDDRNDLKRDHRSGQERAPNPHTTAHFLPRRVGQPARPMSGTVRIIGH